MLMSKNVDDIVAMSPNGSHKDVTNNSLFVVYYFYPYVACLSIMVYCVPNCVASPRILSKACKPFFMSNRQIRHQI